MKLKLILNPAAGGGRPEKIWPEVKDFLENKGIAYDLEKTSARGEAVYKAKNALATGFDTVVAIGGDGTANEIANGLAESDATFGMIPCGEGNDFPKMLGLSEKNIREACEVIAGGFIRKVDLGIVNGRYFLNMVGIGFDGEVAAYKDKVPKFLHGLPVYLYAFLAALLAFSPKMVKIDLDGTRLETAILLTAICNGRCCANALWLAPLAEIDDGILNVSLVKYVGKLKTLWNLKSALKNELLTNPYVTLLKAKEISVASTEPLFAHLDGEVMKADKFEIKILPRKLNVLAKKP